MGSLSNSIFARLRKLPDSLSDISNIGIDLTTDVMDKSLSISRKESDRTDPSLIEEFAGALQDIYNPAGPAGDPSIPFYNKSYEIRRQEFYKVAANPEIEFILHTVCNEAIVTDESVYFADLKVNMKLQESLVESINKIYKNIYSLYHFDEGQNAWEVFLEWLVEGYKAYEIVWDNLNNPKNIEGFVELDASSIYPTYRIEEKNGTKRKVKVWVQKIKGKQNSTEERTFSDNQIVFIAYNRVAGYHGMVSYVERLIRSFNLLRTMENCKTSWNIMNSMFRMKMVIPVGSKTSTKAKQSLAQIMNKYKEDLVVDHKYGVATINGNPNFNWAKTIILPMRAGETPDVGGVKFDGYDLSNMDIVNYFREKLQRDSWIPYSRFDRNNGSGANIIFGADGIPFDELQFHKFIKRLRSEFSQLLLKPIYLQAVAQIESLAIDKSFKSSLVLTYDANNLYEEAKRQEIEGRALEHITKLQGLTKADGTPAFSTKYLMKKYFNMTKEEIEENDSMLIEELNQTPPEVAPDAEEENANGAGEEENGETTGEEENPEA